MQPPYQHTAKVEKPDKFPNLLNPNKKNNHVTYKMEFIQNTNHI